MISHDHSSVLRLHLSELTVVEGRICTPTDMANQGLKTPSIRIFEMANLIKNGDFSQKDEHWTATNPENVHYVSGHCIIAVPDSTSQDVLTGSDGGGQFMLSARLKTLPGHAARITVQPLPTGEKVQLDLHGGQDWIVLSKKFDVQISTLKFKVTLEASDGQFDVPGSYFGDVVLSKLL